MREYRDTQMEKVVQVCHLAQRKLGGISRYRRKRQSKLYTINWAIVRGAAQRFELQGPIVLGWTVLGNKKLIVHLKRQRGPELMAGFKFPNRIDYFNSWLPPRTRSLYIHISLHGVTIWLFSYIIFHSITCKMLPCSNLLWDNVVSLLCSNIALWIPRRRNFQSNNEIGENTSFIHDNRWCHRYRYNINVRVKAHRKLIYGKILYSTKVVE